VQITAEELGEGRAVLRVEGRLNLVTAPELRAAVERAVAAGTPRVVIDLSGVAFIDSSGLGMVIAGLKHARQAGGELRIAAAGEQVRMVLELTKLSRILRPYETVDEALEGL
jgi:anti-sigma B factor antagonist